jgi:hypothetical protein
MDLGAPQGSVLAATLFRLHVHFLPAVLANLVVHMFADYLAIVFAGLLENKFSVNIIHTEKQADAAMKQLEKYANDNLLPVNTNKTKALLVHSVVAPAPPKIQYEGQTIEHVLASKYLGVTITAKLGWRQYVNERMRKVRNIYSVLRVIYKSIPFERSEMRRKLFLAYALPHFCWLFCTWFYLSENQKKQVEHVFCSGLRLTYALRGWDDISIMIMTREKSLLDYLFSYWTGLSAHLETVADALDFQQSWRAYRTIKYTDKSRYKTIDFRKNSKFPNRLIKRAQYTLEDWANFKQVHEQQYLLYMKDAIYLHLLVYKFFIEPPQLDNSIELSSVNK